MRRNKFAIYAAIGVAEVWRYDGTRVIISRLAAGEYATQEVSVILPGVTSHMLSQLLADGQSLKRNAWLQRIRETVREQIHPAS